MFARVSRYQVEPDRLDEAVEGFREASSALAELDGAAGGYLLVDWETGSAITITLWDSRNALDASDTRAASLRRRAMAASAGTVQAVEKYEVAVEFET
jgi:heme-degrading monooxygenase HmoA